MIDHLFALLSLFAPGVSAWVLMRLAGPGPRRVMGLMAGIILYMTCLLGCVHACEIMRIAGFVSSLRCETSHFSV